MGSTSLFDCPSIDGKTGVYSSEVVLIAKHEGFGSSFHTGLVYMILVQKQRHTAMMLRTLTEKGKVGLKRHLAALGSHPLSAIDNALDSM